MKELRYDDNLGLGLSFKKLNETTYSFANLRAAFAFSQEDKEASTAELGNTVINIII